MYCYFLRKYSIGGIVKQDKFYLDCAK
ncbi:DUF1496 domain-containing protein [Anaerospora hongkongensis]